MTVTCEVKVVRIWSATNRYLRIFDVDSPIQARDLDSSQTLVTTSRLAELGPNCPGNLQEQVRYAAVLEISHIHW
jgi:hypothetical protein